MGNLGDAVSSLLDTYTKCLSLLKRLNRDEAPLKPDDSRSSAELTSALRKARARVSRNYSSGLEHRGESFQKGDATSRGSLRRVLRSLTTTMSGLGSWFARKDGDSMPPDGGLDYSSLVSLCNSSQADAVRAMTDLSSRISSRKSARSLTASSTKSSKRSTKSHSSSSSSTGHRHQHSHREKSGSEHRRPETRGPEQRGSKHRSDHGRTMHRRSWSEASRSSQLKRLSQVTTSTDSTKIGELRGRGGRKQGSVAAYPRHSLDFGRRDHMGVKEKKRWWQF